MIYSCVINRYLSRLLMCVSIPMLSYPCFADEGSLRLSTGVDYSSGDYGNPSDTDITYLPLTTSYKKGEWTAKVTAAVLSIEGPGNVIGAGEGGVILPGNNNSAVSKESGVGDVWLSLGYELDLLPAEFGFLDVIGKIKLPVADEDKGLGTGETDYTLQLDYAYSAGAMTPLVTLAYKVKGDPSGVNLDNVLYLSAGADWRFSDQLNMGASIDFQEASTSSSDDSLELFTYLSFRLSKIWSVTPYLYLGLSDGSPDQGIGFQLTYRP